MDGAPRSVEREFSTLADMEREQGRPLEQWTAEEARQAVRELSRAVDIMEATAQRAKMKWPRPWPGENLLFDIFHRRKRGRKLDIDVPDAHLLKTIRAGREFGDRYDVEALRSYVEFRRFEAGLPTTGWLAKDEMRKQVSRLQKRVSEARRRLPK